VVETNTVPKNHGRRMDAGGFPDPSATEPDRAAHHRKLPEILEQTELRDDQLRLRSPTFPWAAFKKARRWLRPAQGKRGCLFHLPRSRPERLGKVPRLAGRSPSYIVRQLYDMKSGARVGIAAQKMRPVVARLTLDEHDRDRRLRRLTQPISPWAQAVPQASLRVPSCLGGEI